MLLLENDYTFVVRFMFAERFSKSILKPNTTPDFWIGN